MTGGPKGKPNPKGRKQHSEPETKSGSGNSITRTVTGTRRDYTLDRLTREHAQT